MKVLREKRIKEVKTLQFILKEAKKDRTLREGKNQGDFQKQYLAEANKAINAYYAYALLERELRMLSEAASLVAQEDATITFLLKNLGHSENGNEIGQYVLDKFSDLIKAVETLHRNAGEQETGAVGKPARSGGYGGGMSMGTAGIVRELFGSPPTSSKRAISRFGGSSAKPPPQPPASKNSDTLGNYMSNQDKGMEKQANIAGENEKAMQTLETQLPKAAEFLRTFIKVFTDPKVLNTLSQPSKKGFFGGNSKESALKSAFGKFPDFNVALFARDLEDSGVVRSLAQTAKQMAPDVNQLEPVRNLVKGKLGQSIKNKLSGFFGQPQTA